MKISSIILSLLIFSAFTFTPKATKFEYELNVGDQYEWVQTTNQTIKQSVMGMDQVIENRVNASMILKVKSLTATGAVLETTYSSMSMLMKMPAGMGEQNLDSNGDQEKAENKVMKSLTNKPFTITITKAGMIESVDGEENLLADLTSLGLNDQQVATMKSTLGQNLNDESLKASFQSMLVTYPDKAIKPGEKWTNKIGAAASFPLETENTWNLVSMASGIASLSGSGAITTTDKEKVVTLPNGIKTKFDLAGTQTITNSVNAKSGWATSGKISSEIKGNMNLLAGGMIPQDMQVPMSIITNSDFKITKK